MKYSYPDICMASENQLLSHVIVMSWLYNGTILVGNNITNSFPIVLFEAYWIFLYNSARVGNTTTGVFKVPPIST